MTVRVVSGDSATVQVGGTWSIVVSVRTSGLQLVSQEPAVTVTLPDDTTTAATVTYLADGTYIAEYVPTVAGRHVASIVTDDHGAAAAVGFALDVLGADAVTVPDLADTKAYLGKTSATDTQIQDALDAEIQAQRDVCRIPAAYTAALRRAVLRRVARSLFLQSMPVAVLQGDAEAGSTSVVLPVNDPEVRRWERPYRRLTVG